MTENTPHIMVVDDELSMREVLELMLTKEGYRVTCAENGRNAIGLLGKDHYDLMLCDIKLGDISGLDVLQASKKSKSKITSKVIRPKLGTHLSLRGTKKHIKLGSGRPRDK